MEFIIIKNKENAASLARMIGYRIAGQTIEGEISLLRPLLRADYPRFHIYLKKTEKGFIFNLHLDQKKPSYQGSAAHSGEYEGDLVEKEAARIKNILANS